MCSCGPMIPSRCSFLREKVTSRMLPPKYLNYVQRPLLDVYEPKKFSATAIGGSPDCQAASVAPVNSARKLFGIDCILMRRKYCLAAIPVVLCANEPAAKKREPCGHVRGRSHSDQQGYFEKSDDYRPNGNSSFQRKDFCHQIRWQVHDRAESLAIGLHLEREKSNVGAEAVAFRLE
jgi:hypothetical protein